MKQLSLFPRAADLAVQPDADHSSNTPRPRVEEKHARRDDANSSPSSVARKLDQFYTRHAVAKSIVDWYDGQSIKHDLLRLGHAGVIEPSAGTGAFLRSLPPGTIAYDLDPKAPGIAKADFLELDLGADASALVFGNPPFGKNASKAIKFFNHAASAAKVIAFIVPLTFQKVSVQNRLHPQFHLIAEMPIPKDAFIFEGRRKDVPSVFQIWARQTEARKKLALPTKHPDFEFLPEARIREAHFVVQRVGVHAGRVHRDLTASPSSHYFIKAAPGITELLSVFSRLNLKDAAARTAGQPSLAKTELVSEYSAARLNRPNDVGLGENAKCNATSRVGVSA